MGRLSDSGIVRDAVPARNISHRPHRHQPYTYFDQQELDKDVACRLVIIRPRPRGDRERCADLPGTAGPASRPSRPAYGATAVTTSARRGSRYACGDTTTSRSADLGCTGSSSAPAWPGSRSRSGASAVVASESGHEKPQPRHAVQADVKFIAPLAGSSRKRSSPPPAAQPSKRLTSAAHQRARRVPDQCDPAVSSMSALDDAGSSDAPTSI